MGSRMMIDELAVTAMRDLVNQAADHPRAAPQAPARPRIRPSPVRGHPWVVGAFRRLRGIDPFGAARTTRDTASASQPVGEATLKRKAF